MLLHHRLTLQQGKGSINDRQLTRARASSMFECEDEQNSTPLTGAVQQCEHTRSRRRAFHTTEDEEPRGWGLSDQRSIGSRDAYPAHSIIGPILSGGARCGCGARGHRALWYYSPRKGDAAIDEGLL